MRRGNPIPSDAMDRIVALWTDKPDAAMDLLYDVVDDALYFGHEKQAWPDIEALLRDARWEQASLEMLIGALVITQSVRGKLGDARSRIIELVRVHPQTNEPENRFDRLVGGLEEP
jgi:hypothetical protein